MFVTKDQLKAILDEVDAQNMAKAKRDHALIFLGYYLGLRVGEACILERTSFRHIGDHEAYIRTLKSVPRLPARCGKCGRKWRVSHRSVGQSVECPNCGGRHEVRNPGPAIDATPPEKQPPVIETPVVEYIQRYLQYDMRSDQRWLFESKPGVHLSRRMAEVVFAHYTISAGFDPEYSFHSLRHGRGVHIWERFRDDVMVRDMLRQKTLSAAEFYLHLSPEKQAEYKTVLDSDVLTFDQKKE